MCEWCTYGNCATMWCNLQLVLLLNEESCSRANADTTPTNSAGGRVLVRLGNFLTGISHDLFMFGMLLSPQRNYYLQFVLNLGR